jgi:hypothetical protein
MREKTMNDFAVNIDTDELREMANRINALDELMLVYNASRTLLKWLDLTPGEQINLEDEELVINLRDAVREVGEKLRGPK